MDKDYFCEFCEIETEKVCGITNLHLTGDPKYISIRKCPTCGKSYLFIYLYAHLGSGDNLLFYRISLDEKEADHLKDVMESCPNNADEDCECSAHDIINGFEIKNIDRRVTLIDDMDRW